MKIRFYIALWASKFHVFCLRLIKQHQDDKPGILALKICDNFLEIINKPKTVIAVTGTNGKTTVSNMLAELLIKDDKKVVYNDWGANTRAASARCLIDAVTIFNKSKKDVAVLETDEISSNEIFPFVKPDYIIITNLFRDSMHRNAHPSFVFKQINDYIPKKTTLILNCDDPISSQLGKNNKHIFYGIKKQENEKEKDNIVIDARICPKCYSKLNYNFRRYHHLGNVSCPNCDFKSYEADYLATKVDLTNKKMTVEHQKNTTTYNLSSDSIFNAYNTLACICLLKEIKTDDNKIINYLNNQKIVASRYSNETINNIQINTIATKGLNAVATSRVCDYLSTIKENMELIIVIDDTFDNRGGSEAICWIYDADFEFLNKENIKRIIIGGVRNKDYRLRLLLAGIADEKIICVDNEQDTYKYLSLKDTKKIFILHEVYYITGANKIKENIKLKINMEAHDEN